MISLGIAIGLRLGLRKVIQGHLVNGLKISRDSRV